MTLADFPLAAVPRKLLIANTVLFAVYSVGVVAAFYASDIDLHARTTASGLSGLVNGVGTIAFALFIDPTTALIVDQTVREERPRTRRQRDDLLADRHRVRRDGSGPAHPRRRPRTTSPR